MKKSISFVLILAIVLSLLAPIGVLAEGEDSLEVLYNNLKDKFKEITLSDSVTVLNLYNMVTENWEDIATGNKEYLDKKGIDDESIKDLFEVLKQNKETIKNIIDTKSTYTGVKNELKNLVEKLYVALPEPVKQSINKYAGTREEKLDIGANLMNAFLSEKFGSGDYKDNKYIKLNIKLEEKHKTKANEAINNEQDVITQQHIDIANSLISNTLSKLGSEDINNIGTLLVKTGLITKKPIKDSETPSTGGGGGGGTTTPSTPKVPGEIHVPNDKTEPATSTIGKKEATVKTVEDIVNIKVKEKESVQAVEALRKKAGKDREATLLVRLDDVKGMNLNVELPEKLIAALLKEKVDLNIVTKDLEYVIPSDALADVKIPVGATIRLKTEEVAENVEVEEHQNAKKTIELYLEIVKGTEVTKVSKFKTSVVVKVNVQGLGDKDKLAVYFLNEENNELEFVTGKIVENKAILKLNHFSKYVIIESTKTFEDIDKHWAKLYIESMAAKEVVDGYDNGTFKPDVQVTRAEFAKMVLKGLEAEIVKYNGEFADVNANDWYADYLATMKKLGLIEGYGDGTFKPNEKISRAEMASILSNLVDVQVSKEEVAEILDKFIDKDNVPAWAAESIAKVVKAKIMVGKNGKFAPVDNSTRAESATTIYRIY